MKYIAYLIKRMFGFTWVVRKCGFPYAKGYATYMPAKRTILDTGLSKEHAEAICRNLNGFD